MEYNDFYIGEYKRLIDNINISDASLNDLTDNIESLITSEKNNKKKQIVAASAALIVAGVSVKIFLNKRR